MERYNIFQLIHKGLRAALYQTALQLQQTDFTDTQETENALNRVREIVMLFEGHAAKEDRYVFSAINAYEPSVVASFESEHEEDNFLGQQLRAYVEKLEQAPRLLEKIVLGGELTEAFTAFMAFNLRHMAKEEDIVNKILWRYYSDDEIKNINAQILQATPPWIQEFFMTWMLRGINDVEAVNWMKAIGKTRPEVVLQSILQKAEQEWPVPRYRKIAGSLKEESVLA
ncbi:MAG: hemerythrin domain-containing protein [Flavisolibacter sp.]